MPAEWELHEATWLTWPKNRTTWPGKHLKTVEAVYLRMMRALLDGEKVHLLVPDEKSGRAVLKRLEAKKARTSNLVLHRVRTADAWIRDYGPIFVKRGRDTAFTKWTFNAWGGKYRDLARDNAVVGRISYLKNFKRADEPMVLEGGSIDVDGRGTLLTTEQCLLNKNRNPHLTRKDIEGRLKKYLGVRKVLWLKEGIEGDDTDGHVDDITRFVAPGTVLTAVEPDRREKNHWSLEENLEILKQTTDAAGKRLKVVEFPMPGKIGRLPASYANFYIGNAAVLLPVYSHRNDRPAVKILKKLFPRRKIVPIECTSLIFGLGSIHCVTQQQPA